MTIPSGHQVRRSALLLLWLCLTAGVHAHAQAPAPALDFSDTVNESVRFSQAGATFTPERLTVFPQGGHLGNLFDPAVQNTIVEALAGLQPAVAPHLPIKKQTHK